VFFVVFVFFFGFLPLLKKKKKFVFRFPPQKKKKKKTGLATHPSIYIYQSVYISTYRLLRLKQNKTTNRVEGALQLLSKHYG